MLLSTEWKKSLGSEGMSEEEIFTNCTGKVHPDDLERMKTEFAKVVQQKQSKFSHEFRINTDNGDYIWILGQGKILYDNLGNPVQIYGTQIDITEKKLIDMALLYSEFSIQ